jgi:hypothetical protein
MDFGRERARTCEALTVAKYATVDEYIAALPKPLGTVAQSARLVIDASN